MPCISPEAKDLMKAAFPDNAELAAYLNAEVPSCTVSATAAPAAKPEKVKRPPSAWQEFASKCLKARMAGQGFDPSGAAMKECALEWKARKAA